MTQVETFIKEMEQEAATTRRMLERVPTDKFGWQPHPKSMTIKQLAGHIAELPGWVTLALTSDGLDFANNHYVVPDVNSTEDVLNFFEKTYADGMEHLRKATDADLQPTWTLRNGEQVLNVATKGETIRVALNQTTHHRAQLGVYLRLLNIPIPGSYGPSADETWG